MIQTCVHTLVSSLRLKIIACAVQMYQLISVVNFVIKVEREQVDLVWTRNFSIKHGCEVRIGKLQSEVCLVLLGKSFSDF